MSDEEVHQEAVQDGVNIEQEVAKMRSIGQLAIEASKESEKPND